MSLCKLNTKVWTIGMMLLYFETMAYFLENRKLHTKWWFNDRRDRCTGV